MEKEEKVAHINGRYLALIAIIGLVGTFATLFYQGKNNSLNPSISQVNIEKKDEKRSLEKSPNKNNANTFVPTAHENIRAKREIETAGVFSFTGTVVDRESNAVAGIEVTWGSQKTVSQEDGTFSLQIPNTLKGQELKIVLSKNGKSYPPIENPSGTVFVFAPN